jgi:hypothetical protein
MLLFYLFFSLGYSMLILPKLSLPFHNINYRNKTHMHVCPKRNKFMIGALEPNVTAQCEAALITLFSDATLLEDQQYRSFFKNEFILDIHCKNFRLHAKA